MENKTNFELIDFFENPLDFENLQKSVGESLDYIKIGAKEKEIFPENGGFLDNQKQVIRFLQKRDKLLLFREPGTGKTCSFLGASEWFKETKNSGIKKTIILAPKNVAEEIKYQLVNKCTVGKYNKIIHSSKGRPKMQKERENIRPFYEITTYDTFRNDVTKKLENITENKKILKLNELYKNTLFILDEAHNTRFTTKNNETSINKESTYEILHEIFHNVSDIKIILSTATPMIDSHLEIKNLMNLLLPIDNQIQDKDFKSNNYESLRGYFRNIIFYLRKPNTGIKINIKTNNHKNLYMLEMGEYQSNKYKNISTNNSSLYKTERDTSNFIYPNGSTGNEGFKSYLKYNKESNSYLFINDNKKREFEEFAVNGQAIEKHSVKAKHLLDESTKNKGIFLVYFGEFLSGALAPISLCYKYYKDYKIYKGVNPYNDLKNLKKAKRIAYIHGEINNNHRTNIINLLNHEDNRNGEYLKGLLISKVSGEGININNGLSFFNFSSVWNIPTLYQAENRIVRVNSHISLLKENKNNKPIDVNFYYYASMVNKKHEDDVKIKSIDEYIFNNAIEKDKEIKKIERIMKEEEITCLINRERNILPKEYDDTKYCEYTKCCYECKEKIVDINTTNYDLFYNYPEIKKLSKKLMDLFSKNPKYSLTEIKDSFPKKRMKILLITLDYMIKNQVYIKDDFGIKYYLNEKNNIFFISRSKINGGINSVNEIIINKQSYKVKYDIEDELSKVTDVKKYLIDNIKNQSKFKQIIEKSFISDNESGVKTKIIDLVSGNILFKITYPRKLIEKRPKSKTLRRNNYQEYVFPEEEKGEEKVYVHVAGCLSKQKEDYIRATGLIRKFNKNLNKWEDIDENEKNAFGMVLQREIVSKLSEFEEPFLMALYWLDKEYFIIKENKESMRSNTESTGMSIMSLSIKEIKKYIGVKNNVKQDKKELIPVLINKFKDENKIFYII